MMLYKINNFTLKQFRVFIIVLILLFSFNFIPSKVSEIAKKSPGVSSDVYSFLDAKNPFILNFEIAKADVGIGTLTAGGLALLEGVLMPYVLGGLGVAGFLYGDTKFRQAEANIRRWAQVSADVATQLNETASKKKVGDTVTLDELPQNLVQKMVYELGKVNYDGANVVQTQFAEILKANTDYVSSHYSPSLVKNIYDTIVVPRISTRNEIVIYRFRGTNTLDFNVFNYSDVYFDSSLNRLSGVSDVITYYFSNPSNIPVDRNLTFNISSSSSYPYAPYSDIDLGRIKYRINGQDTTYGNSVSYYPPSRTGSSDGQSISVPVSYPVTVPTDGTWTRSPDAPVPVSVPDTNVGTVDVPINDVDVIPRDTTGDPDIPIPSDQTGFWSGLWNWLKAILQAILSIPGKILTGIGDLIASIISAIASVPGAITSFFTIDWTLVADHVAYDDIFKQKFKPFYDITYLLRNISANPSTHSGKFYMVIPQEMGGDGQSHCVLDLTVANDYIVMGRAFINAAIWIGFLWYLLKLFSPKLNIG